MNTAVEYILSLKDGLSGKLETADMHAHRLEHTMGAVNEMLGVIGIAGAAFAGFEFLKSAHEDFEKLHQSEVQLENTLKNTGDRAGFTGEQMIQMAEDTSHSIKATESNIVDVENALSRFGSIGGENFKKAIELSADMAASLKTDGVEVARSLARILDSPAQNARLLRQYGITLTKSQREALEAMDKLGEKAKEQTVIFQLLADRGYGGAAAAAANADPAFQFSKGVEEMKLQVGELVNEVEKDLMPTALEFLGWMKSSVHWIKENKTEIGAVVKALGVFWVTLETVNLVIIPFVEGLTMVAPAATEAAVGVEAVGVAAETAMGPIGILAAAVTGLIYLFTTLGEKQEAAKNKYLGDTANDEDDFVTQGMEKYKGKGDKAAFKAALQDEISDVAQERKTYEGLMQDALKSAGYKSYDEYQKDPKIWGEGMRDDNIDAYNKELEIVGAREKGISAVSTVGRTKAMKGPADKKDLPEGPPKEPKTKATGSKSVTINVTINGGLIHEQTIQTTVVKEAANKVKDLMTAALTDAVNDFQVTADVK